MLKHPILLTAIIIATILAVVMLFLSENTKAHEWYDYECCSETDCHPLPVDAVQATPEGWFIKESGETIPYGDPRERKSKDSGYHRCTMTGYTGTGRILITRCLYVPDLGS